MLANVGCCTELNERLLTAVHNSNYEETLSCLMQGARATFISYSCGRTAIGSAALMGDTEILQLLIQSCEEPDLIFQPEKSKSNEIEIDTTPEGMDCLEWEDEFNASNNSDNSNDETVEEFTSLYYYYAKTFERTGDIVSNLENYFCDRNNSMGSATAATTAGAGGSSNASVGNGNAILMAQDPHTLDHMTMAPLHYAAVGGDCECARILLEHGAKVDVTTAVGYTPLHIGADNCDITQLLLEFGANPNAKTFNTAETPLHAALKYRNSNVANLLLQTNKININEIDEHDKTPLMYAIAYDQFDIAMELIRKGARVNLQDKDGNTALFYAVQKNNIPLASCLLERGARHITSHYLLHHCIDFDMPEMLRLLLRYDENLNSLKVRNPDGFTAIQLAIIYKKSNMLEYMLQLDASSLAMEIDNDLILAVQYIDKLEEFKLIARILFAHVNGLSWMTSPSPSTSSSSIVVSTSSTNCYVPFCHTPLSRAVTLNKLHIAEFLLKEGVGIQQICYDHVVNSLRTLRAPGAKEFSKFLVLNGFKFPYYKSSKLAHKWSLERQEFEEDLKRLATQPLELNVLTRIQLRKHLIQTFANSTVEMQNQYRASKEKSSLQKIIEQLEIPKSLQKYLIDFDDCTSVMALYN
ncbi:ankyrin-1 [Musca vetustissima]|uniref:ankyrin-1-like n=1 Tax=Musca vetustissima TaxID=27455 RepID=UPI002AB75AD4|nr:ankyrin-1-like [Musca vetustissima]XP_061402414.1 ankyrin-1 [Musca vetustissima]